MEDLKRILKVLEARRIILSKASKSEICSSIRYEAEVEARGIDYAISLIRAYINRE